MENVQGVRTFVGLDAHSRHCNFRALSRQGRCIREGEVATSSKDLQAALKGLPSPAWVMLEASGSSALVVRAIDSVVDRVIICETRENRWIARSEDKSDRADADRLARLLRMGEFREVYMPRQRDQDVRELAHAYRKAVQDVTRLKNRLKAKYREHGLVPTGSALYTTKGRVAWLDRIQRPSVRHLLEIQYEALDGAEQVRDRIAGRLKASLKTTRPYRLLRTIPGVGAVVASVFIAVISDPWRFAGKRKLWKYAGLSVRRSSSGASPHVREGGAYTGNRYLKHGAMTAAHTALQGRSRFARHYNSMVSRGVTPAMAKKTVARQILATALSIWKSDTEYRDT